GKVCRRGRRVERERLVLRQEGCSWNSPVPPAAGKAPRPRGPPPPLGGSPIPPPWPTVGRSDRAPIGTQSQHFGLQQSRPRPNRGGMRQACTRNPPATVCS